MSQAETLASHWVILFFLSLLNKYMLVWSVDYVSAGRLSARQDYIQRAWSEWSTWSTCSRSCGGGVKRRTRSCKISTAYNLTAPPNSCFGETVGYEICSVHNCSPYDKEFLEYQCYLRDGQVVRGKIIEEWIPYRYGKNPCELQCWSKDRSLVYSFGKVIDGTKCATQDPRQPALCINGRCTPVDCAGQIGLDNKVDRCGVCRGNNSTCIHYKDIFWGRPRVRTLYGEPRDHHYDYEKITTIPSGSTEILIRESSETNFLALMDHRGTYLINGNWRIQSPGRVFIHGSEFIYNRTWDGTEFLSAQGPTRYDFHVYVLGSGDIPSVIYEYWISSSNPSRPVQSFQVLNQIKQIEKEDNEKHLQPENNHIHDARPTKKHYIPVTQFQGYKSYYHRNEILKSVPSWSIKRHRAHKENLDRYSIVQNDISSSTTKNSAELITPVSPHHTKQVASVDEHANEIDTEGHPPKRQKNVLANSRTRSYNTINKPYSPRDLYNTSFHKTTVKPLYSHKIHELTQRHEINTTTPPRRRGFKNDERTSDVRSTTVLALTRSNNYYHQVPVVTHQPNSPTKETESFIRYTNGGKNQRLLKNEEKRKNKKKKRKSENDNCQPCPKTKHQKKNFCTSEFVLRAVVLSVEKQDDSYRYEMQVVQSYKNRVPISPREYIWTASPCRCPKLRPGKEYVVMGYSGGDRRESRLLMDSHSFARKYSPNRARTVQRFVRDQSTICRAFQ